MNPLDYHIWGTMLGKYKFQPKHKTTDELTVALQTIWEEMPSNNLTIELLSEIRLTVPFDYFTIYNALQIQLHWVTSLVGLVFR